MATISMLWLSFWREGAKECHWGVALGFHFSTTMSCSYCLQTYQCEWAAAAHACAKTRNFEASLLPATDPKIRQHLIFCSLHLKLLICLSKSWSILAFPYLRLLNDVILRSFCSVYQCCYEIRAAWSILSLGGGTSGELSHTWLDGICCSTGCPFTVQIIQQAALF